MRTIYHIMRKEFLQIRRDPRMLLMSFLAPIVQLMLMGYAATTDVRSIPLAVCDLDHSSASREVVRQFTNSGYFEVERYLSSIREIDREVEYGNAWIALVIPPGFGDNLLGRTESQVQLIVDGSDANSANIGLGYAQQILKRHSLAIIANVVHHKSSVIPSRVVPEVRVWYNPDLKSRNFMVPGVVALVLMIVTMTLASVGVVKEKETGTLEQLLVTPIKPYQLILGKLLPFVIIGAIDVTLVLAVARFWFGVPFRGSILLMYGLSGLFVLTTLGLGLFVSTISRTQQQAMMTAQFFILMPFIFLSGFAFPIENMPAVIQYITYLIPLRYFITIIRGIFLKGVGIEHLWYQAVPLVIFGVAILTLSVLRFRKRLG